MRFILLRSAAMPSVHLEAGVIKHPDEQLVARGLIDSGPAKKHDFGYRQLHLRNVAVAESGRRRDWDR